MSLINDALKRARHNHTPRDPHNPLPPLPPADDSSSVSVWLTPAIVIFLIFFLNLAFSKKNFNSNQKEIQTG